MNIYQLMKYALISAINFFFVLEAFYAIYLTSTIAIYVKYPTN